MFHHMIFFSVRPNQQNDSPEIDSQFDVQEIQNLQNDDQVVPNIEFEDMDTTENDNRNQQSVNNSDYVERGMYVHSIKCYAWCF